MQNFQKQVLIFVLVKTILIQMGRGEETTWEDKLLMVIIILFHLEHHLSIQNFLRYLMVRGTMGLCAQYTLRFLRRWIIP